MIEFVVRLRFRLYDCHSVEKQLTIFDVSNEANVSESSFSMNPRKEDFLFDNNTLPYAVKGVSLLALAPRLADFSTQLSL